MSSEDFKIITDVVCNTCKETLPPHTIRQHLDPKFMGSFHKCIDYDAYDYLYEVKMPDGNYKIVKDLNECV